jgi:hypothetical protein
MSRRIAAASAVLLLGLAGCDRRVEPWVPVEQEPPRSERPVRVPGLSRPDSRVAPLGVQASPESPESPELRGQIRLAEGVEASGEGALFLIARNGPAGPPLAVKRLSPGPFPMEFVIGPADVMIPGRAFSGPIRLTARVDLDGDPLSRGPGDLQAELDTPVEPGQSGLDLVLR